jgi:hypothetical protein
MPLPLQVASAATSLHPAEVRRRTTALRTANLVRTSEPRWANSVEPYHDRVREAILSRLDPVRRTTLHGGLATAFEACNQLDPEILAMHWRAAGERGRAAHYAHAAGDQAARTFAFDHAASWFGQALELLPDTDELRGELLVKLGDVLALGGRGALAANHFEAAAASAQGGEALELRRRAAEQLLRSGHFDRGLEASRSVLSAVGLRIPKGRLDLLASFTYYGLRLRLRGLNFRQRSEADISPQERTRLSACWSIGLSLAAVDTLVGMVFLRRALLLALAAGDLGRIIQAIGVIASISAAVGVSARRTNHLVTATRELAVRSGSAEASAFADLAAAGDLFFKGCFRAAATQVTQALEILKNLPEDRFYERATARVYLIWSLFYLGRFKELHHRQSEWLRDARARGDVYAAVTLSVGLPNLAWLIEDRPDLATSELDAAMRDWTVRGYHVQHHFALLAQVWVKLYAGDPGGAHDKAEELIGRGKRSHLWRMKNLRLRARYARAGAALAMVQRGLGDRVVLLRRATEDARAIEHVSWMQPFAKVLRAGVLLQAGQRTRALAEINAAAGDFARYDEAAFAAATRDRAARLRADSSSAAEIAAVSSFFRAEGVVAPDRIIEMLVPGLQDPDA